MNELTCPVCDATLVVATDPAERIVRGETRTEHMKRTGHPDPKDPTPASSLSLSPGDVFEHDGSLAGTWDRLVIGHNPRDVGGMVLYVHDDPPRVSPTKQTAERGRAIRKAAVGDALTWVGNTRE